MIHRLMTEHPRSVGESYGEHFKAAASFGWPMVWSGLACVVHGLLPFLFAKTGSTTIRRLHERLECDPERCSQAAAASGETGAAAQSVDISAA